MMRSRGEKIFGFFNGIFFFFFSIIILIPIFAVLKDSVDLGGQADVRLTLIPEEFTMIYYRMVFQDRGIYRPFLNSVMITIVGTTLGLLVNGMAGYTLSRREIRGSKFLVYFLVVIPLVFGLGSIVVNYLYFKELGLLNTYLVMFLPLLVSGWNMILFRQFYWTIPFSLTESAQLDGAPEFTIFWKIIAPMSKAVFAALGLFTGVGFWNNWLYPLLFVRDAEKYTFPVKLRGMLFFGQDTEMWMQQMAEQMGVDPAEVIVVFEGLQAATIIVAVVPILIVYPYLQRHFTAGIRVGAIKA